MTLDTNAWMRLILKISLLSFLASPFFESAFALDEIFDLYAPPQAHGLGNAMTSVVEGYLSNYYNPAGLAKGVKKKAEIIPLDLEGILSFGALGQTMETKSLAFHRLAKGMAAHPGTYDYLHLSSVPAITVKRFSFSVLGSYRFAALSNGATVDIDGVQDICPTIGFGFSTLNRLLKIGFAGKFLLRNEIKGVYAHSAIDTETSMAAAMKEGWAVGADVGLMFTYPGKWLPTLGVVWKDVLNTAFHPSNILNRVASGTPSTIQQTFNIGLSLRPWFAKKVSGLFSVEYRHAERVDLPWTKKFHMGFQLEAWRSWYIWLGLNQLNPSFGLGLRTYGGNLEIATYAQDIAAPTAAQSDRRVMFRYTVSY